MPTLGRRFTTLCLGFLLVFGISTAARAQDTLSLILATSGPA